MSEMFEKYIASNLTPSKGFNCISSLFYLLGLDEREIRRDIKDFEEIKNRCKRVGSINEADIIYLPFPTEHLMILDPTDKDYILHRNGLDSPVIRQSLISFRKTLHPDVDGDVGFVYYKFSY